MKMNYKVALVSWSLALSGACHTSLGAVDIGLTAYRDLRIRYEAFKSPETRYRVADRESYRSMIDSVAKGYGVPAKLVHAVALTESNMNPEATSSCGARGILQVMPFNAKRCGIEPQDLYNAKKNIECGVYILAKNLGDTGNTADALCMYNSGKRCSDNSPAETKGYLVKVLKNLNLG